MEFPINKNYVVFFYGERHEFYSKEDVLEIHRKSILTKDGFRKIAHADKVRFLDDVEFVVELL